MKNALAQIPFFFFCMLSQALAAQKLEATAKIINSLG